MPHKERLAICYREILALATTEDGGVPGSDIRYNLDKIIDLHDMLTQFDKIVASLGEF